jgi:hypothetical protein
LECYPIKDHTIKTILFRCFKNYHNMLLPQLKFTYIWFIHQLGRPVSNQGPQSIKKYFLLLDQQLFIKTI